MQVNEPSSHPELRYSKQENADDKLFLWVWQIFMKTFVNVMWIRFRTLFVGRHFYRFRTFFVSLFLVFFLFTNWATAALTARLPFKKVLWRSGSFIWGLQLETFVDLVCIWLYLYVILMHISNDFALVFSISVPLRPSEMGLFFIRLHCKGFSLKYKLEAFISILCPLIASLTAHSNNYVYLPGSSDCLDLVYMYLSSPRTVTHHLAESTHRGALTVGTLLSDPDGLNEQGRCENDVVAHTLTVRSENAVASFIRLDSISWVYTDDVNSSH